MHVGIFKAFLKFFGLITYKRPSKSYAFCAKLIQSSLWNLLRPYLTYKLKVKADMKKKLIFISHLNMT